MQHLRSVDESEVHTLPNVPGRSWNVVWSWVAGAVLAVVIGSWLVWLSAFLQRKFAEEDIQAACRRVMPETADRCFDTVVIQRGGIRR